MEYLSLHNWKGNVHPVCALPSSATIQFSCQNILSKIYYDSSYNNNSASLPHKYATQAVTDFVVPFEAALRDEGAAPLRAGERICRCRPRRCPDAAWELGIPLRFPALGFACCVAKTKTFCVVPCRLVWVVVVVFFPPH